MLKDCHEGASGDRKMECNSTMIVPTERQGERLSVNLVEESRISFK